MGDKKVSNQYSVDGNAYNRFVNLDNIEYRIADFLAKSDNKYADYLFEVEAMHFLCCHA